MGKAKKICAQCHTESNGKKDMPGSIFIEIVLWCFLIVPGLIYSIWRHSAVKKVCKECGSKDLIPINSPRAIKILAEAKAV